MSAPHFQPQSDTAARLLGLSWIIRGLAGYIAIGKLQDSPRSLKILAAVSLVATLQSWRPHARVLVSQG